MTAIFTKLNDLAAHLDPRSEAPRSTVRSDTAAPASGQTGAVLITGGTAVQRAALALNIVRERFFPPRVAKVLHRPQLSHIGFSEPSDPVVTDEDPVILIGLEGDVAFPDAQTNATRLLLTQSIYLVQKWLDELDRRPGSSLVLTAGTGLRRSAGEAFARRGPWSMFRVIELEEVAEVEPAAEARDAARELESAKSGESLAVELASAFGSASPLERLTTCQTLAERHSTSPVAHVALASACMEQTALDAAQRALDRALQLAPNWEVAHYEQGKLHLRNDDMKRASVSFRRAGELMPSLATAFSNLGATLGELDRPEEALAAFEHAQQFDPFGVQVLNNIGVVSRELGRMDASEAAFRKVVSMAPEFVFGHYNLGHTLFLQGKFEEAVSAYTEGQRRDPQRNPIQASRLALSRLAAGDPVAALDEMRAALSSATPDRRADILMEAHEILGALVTLRGDLDGAAELAALLGAARAADADQAV